jgi:hypothetical protein
MHELLKRAVLPALSLHDALAQWQTIRNRLAEPPRRRVRQCSTLHFILS